MTLGPAEIEYLHQLVRQNAAIVLDSERKRQAEQRLLELVNQYGCASLVDYTGRDLGESLCVVHRKLVDAMSNNETWFFRDFHPFAMLTHTVIPELLRKRERDQEISIWSAGCATGQEPFSIAMALRDHFPSDLDSFSILGTDLCPRVLEQAQQAMYRQKQVNRGLPVRLLTRYFVQHGLRWQLSMEVRRMVRFRRFDLREAWTEIPAMHVVFLRNVLGSFERQAQKKLLEQAHGILRAGGFLFLGNGESTEGLSDAFEALAEGTSVVYRARS